MLMNRTSFLAAAAVVFSLSGCAIVSSTPEPASMQRRGVAYMLPKALLPVQLAESDGLLTLRVESAKLVGDPAQRYFAHNPSNVFSSDEVKIEVDGPTGLLTGVTATSTDNTLAVLKELLKTGAAPHPEGSALSPGETLLFSGVYDPDGEVDDTIKSRNEEMVARLQEVVFQRMLLWQEGCKKDRTDVVKCDTADKLVKALKGTSTGDGAVVLVKATALHTGQKSPRTNGADNPSADCGLGICHRALQPYQIDLAIKGVFFSSTVVQLPNGGPPIVLPLERAPFVKTEHKVVLQSGQITSAENKKPSSALALVEWPLDVYRGILAATSTLIQLRIGYNTDAVKLAESEVNMAKELKGLRDELNTLRQERSSPPPGGRGIALLAGEIGRRPDNSNKSAAKANAAGQPAVQPRPGEPHCGTISPSPPACAGCLPIQ